MAKNAKNKTEIKPNKFLIYNLTDYKEYKENSFINS